MKIKNKALFEELEGIFILAWNTEFHIFCHNSGCMSYLSSTQLLPATSENKEVAFDVTIISTINHYYYSM